jgi:hypothetical protein
VSGCGVGFYASGQGPYASVLNEVINICFSINTCKKITIIKQNICRIKIYATGW